MQRVNLSPFPSSLSISSFSHHFLFIFSLSLHFIAARLSGGHNLCNPGVCQQIIQQNKDDIPLQSRLCSVQLYRQNKVAPFSSVCVFILQQKRKKCSLLIVNLRICMLKNFECMECCLFITDEWMLISHNLSLC